MSKVRVTTGGWLYKFAVQVRLFGFYWDTVWQTDSFEAAEAHAAIVAGLPKTVG